MLTDLSKLGRFSTLVFDAEKGGAGGSSQDGKGDRKGNEDGKEKGGQDGGQEGGKPNLAYDTWIAAQPEEVRTMLDGHVKGLKSALDSERDGRKDLEKQLRDLAKKAEEGSEAQKSLTEMADQVAEADRKTDFYEAAHAAGVSNLKLAYLVATDEGLFDRRGSVNFEAMKKDFPELFGAARKSPKGSAGEGTDQDGQPKTTGMNAFIRAAAGRRT